MKKNIASEVLCLTVRLFNYFFVTQKQIIKILYLNAIVYIFTAPGFLIVLQIIHITIPLPVIGCYNKLDLLISGSMADIVYGIDRRTASAEVEGTLRLSADF